jgi:FkbM family methyltransferase
MSVSDHAALLTRLREQGHDFRVFFDVGANIGRWSVEVQKAFPDARFELFEPLATRVSSVDEMSMVERLTNGTLHPVALSDETRTGEIKILGNNGVGSSILVLTGDRKKDLQIIPCEMSRMDDYVERHGLPQPDVIKLDVQAAELKVLKGAMRTLRGTKIILLETWLRRVYGPETPLFHEVSGWLYEQGFVLLDFLALQDGRDADGTLRWFDAVYMNKSESRFSQAML